MDIALAEFGIAIDPASVLYRTVGAAVMRSYVEMLEAIEARATPANQWTRQRSFPKARVVRQASASATGHTRKNSG
jgi:hypothetical protein